MPDRSSSSGNGTLNCEYYISHTGDHVKGTRCHERLVSITEDAWNVRIEGTDS